jgi:predicted DNA-binding transcriptional regulator AlpA
MKMPMEGFVRVNQIVKPHGPIPISRAHWLQGVKDGRYPKPVKLSARITAWRVEDIRTLILSFSE